MSYYTYAGVKSVEEIITEEKEQKMTIRERMEQREHEYLNPKAAFSDETQGRDVPEEMCDLRPEYQRDRDGISL